MRLPESPCQHDRTGYGGCGPVIYRVLYEEHIDGCWMAKLGHPHAGALRMDGHHGRTSIWWMGDKDDRPKVCFRDYPFDLPLRVKRLAQEILAMIPAPSPPREVVEELYQEVDRLRRQVEEMRNLTVK